MILMTMLQRSSSFGDRLCHVREGDRLGLVLDSSRNIYLHINDDCIGVISRSVADPCHFMVDLCVCLKKVCLRDSMVIYVSAFIIDDVIEFASADVEMCVYVSFDPFDVVYLLMWWPGHLYIHVHRLMLQVAVFMFPTVCAYHHRLCIQSR